MNANWQQWTLRHIRGLVEKLEQLEHSLEHSMDEMLSHAGGGSRPKADQVERDEFAGRLERMRAFAARTDLNEVDAITDRAFADPIELPGLVLQRLAPYFDGALLLQQAGPEMWHLSAFVTRGEFFKLEPEERLNASHLVQPLGPDQVLKANAGAMLAELPLPFALSGHTAQAYLCMPQPGIAYILISDIPPLWSEDHVRSALRLLNQAFNS
jgi:hypothetical protein